MFSRLFIIMFLCFANVSVFASTDHKIRDLELAIEVQDFQRIKELLPQNEEGLIELIRSAFWARSLPVLTMLLENPYLDPNAVVEEFRGLRVVHLLIGTGNFSRLRELAKLDPDYLLIETYSGTTVIDLAELIQEALSLLYCTQDESKFRDFFDSNGFDLPMFRWMISSHVEGGIEQCVISLVQFLEFLKVLEHHYNQQQNICNYQADSGSSSVIANQNNNLPFPNIGTYVPSEHDESSYEAGSGEDIILNAQILNDQANDANEEAVALNYFFDLPVRFNSYF